MLEKFWHTNLPFSCKYIDMQDELNMTKDIFQSRFGDDPRRDDLTLLAPKQDDPTEQVLYSVY